MAACFLVLRGIIVKLHILSDLHLEFARFDPIETDAARNEVPWLYQ